MATNKKEKNKEVINIEGNLHLTMDKEKENDKGEKNDDKERSVRWQQITINQLSYVINLILGLSVAALGFASSLLLNKMFNLANSADGFFVISLISLLMSGFFGVWCTINRLRDFRLTAKITKIRDGTEVQELRKLTRRLGEKTWILFWWQIGTFSFGILLMVISVVVSTGSKLL